MNINLSLNHLPCWKVLGSTLASHATTKGCLVAPDCLHQSLISRGPPFRMPDVQRKNPKTSSDGNPGLRHSSFVSRNGLQCSFLLVDDCSQVFVYGDKTPPEVFFSPISLSSFCLLIEGLSPPFSLSSLCARSRRECRTFLSLFPCTFSPYSTLHRAGGCTL